MKKYIKKEDLIIGSVYECDARNFTYGKWNGTAFEYERLKFYDRFMDTENHWDDGPPHGTVKPLIEVFDKVLNLFEPGNNND